MAKVKLIDVVKDIRGKFKDVVFRRSHNGEISVYMRPDMSHVEWSPAQQANQERFAEAVAYARAAMADPEIRVIYEQRSLERKNNKRPFDMAISDYRKGNNLLGDRFQWDAEAWRAEQKLKKKKKRQR